MEKSQGSVVLKTLLKSLMPHGMYQQYIRYNGSYSGNYASWSEAIQQVGGYSQQSILQQVKSANIQAINQGKFERDGAVFSEPQYRYPILAYLQKALLQDSELCVLDFGGAFGTSYRHFRHFYPNCANVSWFVIEQPEWVEEAQYLFENASELAFIKEIALMPKKPNVILLSSVLTYLANPEDILRQLQTLGAQWILIDRTPMIQSKQKKLCLQTVKYPYHAKYPAWLFPFDFFERLLQEYKIETKFSCDEGTILSREYDITFQGMGFQKK